MPDELIPRNHMHDWRVDPNQLVAVLGAERRLRVVCAAKDCHAVAMVRTTGPAATNPDRPETWRAYRYKLGDIIEVESS